WPQQVCASGKSTVTPSRRKRRTVATPTSGKRASPRHVTNSETRIGLLRLAASFCERWTRSARRSSRLNEAQQAPTFRLQAHDQKAKCRLCHLVEIRPPLPTARKVRHMRHAQRIHLFVQPIVAAIPRVIRIDAIEDVRGIMCWMQVQKRRILPALFLAVVHAV